VITPEIVIPYIPPQIIEIDTNLEPLPTIEEPMPEPPIEELLTDGESVPVGESLIEETLEQVTQELEQESQLEGPIDTPIDNQGEPTSETVESQEPITQAEMNNLVEDLVSSGEVTSQDAVEILETLSQDGEITQDEVNNLSEALSADGTFTESERELVAEALIESAEGEAVTVEAIAEAGITLDDLPPSTPVEVRQDANGNEVIVTAEVAAALVVLESPVELLTTIFSDPAQALLAISSIGADMSDEERAESEQTIVAAVIVSGIAVQSAASAALAGSASYRRRM
jgi:polyhydroxyalkanoate synthesis regulator phasin